MFSLLLHSLRIINRLPVDGYASHISLTANHLTALCQRLAHNLLQGSTATLHRINQVGCFHTALVHGSTQSVDRHIVWSLGKGSREESNVLCLLNNVLEIVTLTAISTSRVAFIKDKVSIIHQFLDGITSSLSAESGSAERFTLRKLFLFSGTILIKLVNTIAYLTVGSQYVVVFLWQLAVLFDVIKHSLHLALRWQSKYYFSV